MKSVQNIAVTENNLFRILFVKIVNLASIPSIIVLNTQTVITATLMVFLVTREQ